MRAKIFSTAKALPFAACGLAIVVAAGCERPPMDSVQRGYRGLGQTAYINPRILAPQVRANVAPEAQPPAVPVPVAAGTVYKNLQVLGDVPITEFTRLMLAMTEWVVPKDKWENGQGCVYCHDLSDQSLDTKYTKVVARSMLKMTQRANAAWGAHVSPTGVTCYTCHRGNNLPQFSWATNPGAKASGGFASSGENRLSPVAAFTALPYDPMTIFFDKDTAIPVQTTAALSPTRAQGKTVSTQRTEDTYALMSYMSRSMGVGCGYCHNTRAFPDWSESSPSRVKAWYAIRMVRELNKNFVWPLKDIVPAVNKGPLGDPKRIGCETCHQGVFKPLFAAPMLKDYPVLAQPTHAVAPAPAAAPAAEPAPAAPAAVKTGAEGLPESEGKVTGLAASADKVM